MHDPCSGGTVEYDIALLLLIMCLEKLHYHSFLTKIAGNVADKGHCLTEIFSVATSRNRVN